VEWVTGHRAHEEGAGVPDLRHLYPAVVIFAQRPVSLVIACTLGALEAIALVVCAVLVVVDAGDGEAGSAIGVAVFFVLAAAALGLCVAGLWRLSSWSRAPIVLAQLIMLGLAWDVREDAALASILLVVALAAVVAILHPASLRALDHGSGDDDGR